MLVVVLLVTSHLTSSATAVAQQPDDVTAEVARRHFDAATTAFDGGDYPRAVEEFQRAYELTRHPDILFNVYSAAERAGQLELAQRSLERYLAEGEVEPERRPVLQERLARLRERVAAGQEQAPAPVEPIAEPEPAAPSGGVHPAGVTMLIAAGVLAASFGVLAGLSEAEDGKLAAGCGMSGTCTSDELSTLNALNVAADVSWIAAAAVGVTGLVLLFALPPESTSSAQAAVAPWASPDGAGLVVAGTF